MKEYISDPKMFHFDGLLSRTKQNYYDLYGSMPFFDNVVKKLEICRKLLVGDFSSRFKDLDISILWSSLLDPRFRMKSFHWKDDTE